MLSVINNSLVIDGLTRYNPGFRQQGAIMTDDLAIEVLRLREQGLGIAKIARALGKGHAYVTGVLKANKAYGRPYYMTDKEKGRAHRLRLEGDSHEVIAEKLGRSKAAVVELMKKLKLNNRVLRLIEVNGDVAKVELTRGKVALIDVADVPLVKGRSWFTMGAAGKFYAATRENGAPITLHRFLMRPPENMHVDHVNSDGLDNRRSNLRVASPRQNSANSYRKISKTGAIGVVQTRTGKFYASITLGIGTFDTLEEAMRAYDSKAIELFGEFAMTNKKRGLL